MVTIPPALDCLAPSCHSGNSLIVTSAESSLTTPTARSHIIQLYSLQSSLTLCEALSFWYSFLVCQSVSPTPK